MVGIQAQLPNPYLWHLTARIMFIHEHRKANINMYNEPVFSSLSSDQWAHWRSWQHRSVTRMSYCNRKVKTRSNNSVWWMMNFGNYGRGNNWQASRLLWAQKNQYQVSKQLWAMVPEEIAWQVYQSVKITPRYNGLFTQLTTSLLWCKMKVYQKQQRSGKKQYSYKKCKQIFSDVTIH